MDFQNIINTFVISAFTTGGGTWIFKTYLTERIKGKIKSEYDKELELLKSDLSSQQSLINTVVSSQKDSYNFANSERLNAVKVYWDQYLALSKNIYGITTFDSFILIDETVNEKLDNNARFKETVDSAPNRTEYKPQEEILRVKSIQPFLPETLWDYLTFVNFFTSRIIYLYKTGLIKGNLKHWKKDSYILEITKQNLTTDEYNYLTTSDLNGINAVFSFMEAKILIELERMISGRESAEYSLKHLIQISEKHKITQKMQLQ